MFAQASKVVFEQSDSSYLLLQSEWAKYLADGCVHRLLKTFGVVGSDDLDEIKIDRL